MFIAYIIVTIFTAAANIFSAMADFVRYRQVFINMERAGVPESWMAPLGILKAAGAVGLLIGFRVPLIGAAGRGRPRYGDRYGSGDRVWSLYFV